MKNKTEIAALIYVVLAALKSAKENTGNPLGGVPNGHLYAQLMESWSLEEWARMVLSMVDKGLIAQQNYLLKITLKGEGVLGTLEEIYKAAMPAQVTNEPIKHLGKESGNDEWSGHHPFHGEQFFNSARDAQHYIDTGDATYALPAHSGLRRQK